MERVCINCGEVTRDDRATDCAACGESLEITRVARSSHSMRVSAESGERETLAPPAKKD